MLISNGLTKKKFNQEKRILPSITYFLLRYISNHVRKKLISRVIEHS